MATPAAARSAVRAKLSSLAASILASDRNKLTLIIAVALLLRLIVVALVFRDTAAPTIDHERFGWEMGWTARSIALGHGFSSPFLPFTGPTALVPPLYPYLLALVFHLFGLYTAKAALVILLLNAIFSSLTCIPIYFSVKKTVDSRTALLSAGAWALYPYAIYFSADRVWDYALTGLLFSLCFLATQRIQRHAALSVWFGLGLLFGITILSNPSIGTSLPFLLAITLWRVRRNDGPWISPGLATCIALAVVLAPWCLRNYRELHIVSPVRDGFWLEAYAGNNGDTSESNPSWAHPASSPAEMRRYQTLGEASYMEQKKQLTVDFIQHHPALFVSVSLRRFFRFWTGFWSFSPSYLRLQYLDVPNFFFCTFLTITMLIGLRRWWRRNRGVALAYMAVLALFPMPYYFTHGSADYRQPIEPEVVVLVSAGLFGLREREEIFDEEEAAETEDPANELVLA